MTEVVPVEAVEPAAVVVILLALFNALERVCIAWLAYRRETLLGSTEPHAPWPEPPLRSGGSAERSTHSSETSSFEPVKRRLDVVSDRPSG